MRAIRINTLSETLDNVVLEEVPTPSPQAGEVLVKIEAAGVNFPDVLMCRGGYQHKPDLPFTPGMEFAGSVAGLGASVEGFREGMAVMGSGRSGGFAEYAAVPASALQAKPEALSMPQAAAFPLAALTARVALFRRGSLQKSEVLLVLGAAGGVGLAAVELGAYMGAKVIAVASTAEKRALAEQKGAAHSIAPEPDWRMKVKELTDGKGADVVYDPVAGDYFEEAIRAVAWNGRYLIIGFASGRIPQIGINYPLIKSFSLMGVRAGENARHCPEDGAEDHAFIHEMGARGLLVPHIGDSFPLAEAKAGLHKIATGKALGKIAIIPSL